MPSLELKPTHKVVAAYYDNLAKFARLGIKHETAVRSAFQELLESYEQFVNALQFPTGAYSIQIARERNLPA